MRLISLLFVICVAVEAQQQTIPADRASTDPFSLDLESLANLRVTTASKFDEKLSNAAGIMSVVTKDEMRRFGGFTLAQVLERVAGLNFSTSYFPDRTIVSLRGNQTRGDSGHVLFLINGRPVREVQLGGVMTDLLESFPINVLEKIEVIKGPGSVLYGSNAYSGVVNLITQKSDAQRFHAKAAAGPGGTVTGSQEFALDRGAFNMVAAAQYRQFPQRNLLYRGSPGTNAPPQESASIANGGAGGFLNLNYKGLRFLSSYTMADAATFAPISGTTRISRGFADLGYSVRVSSKWEMSFNATYTRTLVSAPYSPYIRGWSTDAVLEWTNLVTLSASDHITIGTLYGNTQATQNYIAVQSRPLILDANRSSGAFYAQYEHTLPGDLKLIAGVQANKIGPIALDAVPRGGIVWNPTSTVTLKALYGEAFRAPSLLEIGLNHPFNKGNPNLLPEKVRTFDVQASYGGKRTQAGAGYFRSVASNSIVQDFSRGYPLRFANLPAGATIQGVEAEGKRYVSRNWFFMGSFLAQTNRNGFGKRDILPIPKFSAKAGMSYLSESGIGMSFFDAYQGRSDAATRTLNPSAAAFHMLNSHLRFDVTKRLPKSLAFSQRGNGLAFFIYGDNLTGRSIWLPDSSVGSSSAINPTRDTLPFRIGRMITFGMEFWRRPE
jgi:outer membrane receptor for ferrienterochelin and colicins